MTGLADVDGFKFCILDCVLPGFRPVSIVRTETVTARRFILLMRTVKRLRLIARSRDIPQLQRFVYVYLRRKRE